MTHELDYIGGDTKQNSSLDHTKNFILLEKDKTKKDRTKKKVKAKEYI